MNVFIELKDPGCLIRRRIRGKARAAGAKFNLHEVQDESKFYRRLILDILVGVKERKQVMRLDTGDLPCPS